MIPPTSDRQTHPSGWFALGIRMPRVPRPLDRPRDQTPDEPCTVARAAGRTHAPPPLAPGCRLPFRNVRALVAYGAPTLGRCGQRGDSRNGCRPSGLRSESKPAPVTAPGDDSPRVCRSGRPPTRAAKTTTPPHSGTEDEGVHRVATPCRGCATPRMTLRPAGGHAARIRSPRRPRFDRGPAVNGVGHLKLAGLPPTAAGALEPTPDGTTHCPESSTSPARMRGNSMASTRQMTTLSIPR